MVRFDKFLTDQVMEQATTLENIGFVYQVWPRHFGGFFREDKVCDNDNVSSFLMQTLGSMAINGSVHTDTHVSDFYCDIDINGEVFLCCR